MLTYVYETVPGPGKKARQYEIRQSIKDAPLTKHPETGEQIRRCLSVNRNLFVREATVERPEPRQPKPSRRQQQHHDHHDHDHDHHH
jgi:hypothetical protein